jgi:hypothetical protein
MLTVSSPLFNSETIIDHQKSQTGIRYRDEIFHPVVRPFNRAIRAEFVLMIDNTRPHKANIVNEYLYAETMGRME